MRDPDLDALWIELERRRVGREQSVPEQLARAREALIAAFGEADFAAATAEIDVEQAAGDEIIERTRPGGVIASRGSPGT